MKSTTFAGVRFLYSYDFDPTRCEEILKNPSPEQIEQAALNFEGSQSVQLESNAGGFFHLNMLEAGRDACCYNR